MPNLVEIGPVVLEKMLKIRSEGRTDGRTDGQRAFSSGELKSLKQNRYMEIKIPPSISYMYTTIHVSRTMMTVFYLQTLITPADIKEVSFSGFFSYGFV